MKQWPIFRDAVLFLGGLGGVLHETLLTSSERPTLLILFAAMMGLPAFLRQPNGAAPPPAEPEKADGPKP
jgi:hypothetical protein